MKNTSRFYSAAFIISLCGLFSVAAADRLVTDNTAFNKALRAAKPSATIMLKEGVWRDFEMVFSGEGAAKATITLFDDISGITFKNNLTNPVTQGEVLKDIQRKYSV